MKKILSIILFLSSYSGITCLAQPSLDSGAFDSSETISPSYFNALGNRFTYQYEQVALLDGKLLLEIPAGFKFLDQAQSEYVLHDLWANPKALRTLGMLFPEDQEPTDPSSWAFNLNYEEIGYLDDQLEAELAVDQLLERMQNSVAKANLYREEKGYPALNLLGWVAPPRYDSERKVLSWAKKIQFGAEQSPTLNYDIRLLGREGVLSLHAIAPLDYLERVKKYIPAVIQSVSFTKGNRYEDFDPQVDVRSHYRLADLITGEAEVEANFWSELAKFSNFFVFGIAAVGGLIWRFVTGKKQSEEV